MQDRKLFVGNIDESVGTDELTEQFSYFGKVRYVNIINGKGFAFVKMLSPADAENAILGLNGIELKGRIIRVEKARPVK